jgi:beta-carotene hydroxylase
VCFVEDTPFEDQAMAVQATEPTSLRAAARAVEIAAQTRIKHLSGRFAWRTIAFFLAILGGLALSSTLALAGALPYWAAIPINALLIYFSFTPIHEAIHGNIAGRHAQWRWLELVVGHISGFILLAPYPGLERLHIHHHQHTNDPGEDPDMWVRADNFAMAVLRCMAIQPAYIWSLYKLATDPVGRRAFAYEMIYIAVYVAILVAAFNLGFGVELLLLWVLPGYIGVVMCPLLFDWPVHHPHQDRGRYTDSAILLFPKPVRLLVDFLYCGHSYHLMHHLYPRIPFYHYGTAYYALADELPATDAKIRRIGF